MLASIRKFSKSFVAKIFIAIIALPFIMWGMGDVFRSGKQNVIVEINEKKINLKEFITYLQKINLSKEEIDKIGKSKLIDGILSNYISEKIIEIETEKKGIQLTDQGLMKILINDKTFHKDNKFSRTKYEKFLLKSGYTAPTYEAYLKGIEHKGQLLNYYSGGIRLPEFIIKDIYKKENSVKEIEFLDLNKIYSQKKINEEDIQAFYKENKDFFKEKFISFRYLKLIPENLTKKKEFDEEYYEKLDELENKILDGQNFDSIISGNEKSVKKFNLINSRKTREDGTKIEGIENKLLGKIFQIKEKKSPKFINFDNNYYIVEVLDEKDITLSINNKDLRKNIEARLKIRFKIKENIKLIDEIKNKKFTKSKMLEISQKNTVEIKNTKINGINDKKEFVPQLVKKIYDYSAGEIFVLSDSILKENFLIRIVKQIDPKIKNNSEDYKKYMKKANAEYITKVYQSYDKYINSNYKIEVNQKVFERLKNSF
jgi:peptidyl-prolyl cis-trans isomerase D